METLGKWTVTVCAAALSCTLLYRLFPDTSVGRTGRMLLPAIFLCVVLSPLFSIQWEIPNISIEAPENDHTAYSEVIQRQFSETVDGILLKMVNQSLVSYGLKAEKVHAKTDIDAEGSISMGQITVYVNEKSLARSITVMQIAEKRLGVPVLVAGAEGDGA